MATGPLARAWGPLTPGRVASLLGPGTGLPRPALPSCGGSRLGPRSRAAAVDALLLRAAADRGTPWPQPTASTWARVHRDGNRTEHEARVFGHAHRLTRAVVAALVSGGASDDDGGDALLDEVADGVLLWCERSSWCWPAHDDARERTGAVVPDPDLPVLDLGAGEVAGQLAWVDHLLGARLDARWPGLRQRLRREVRARVLRPFRERRDWHWLGLDGDVHNWNPWIHGNVLAAALALLDGAEGAVEEPGEEDERADVVALALEGMDRYVAALPDDGAVDEGPDYWWNGACRALEALELVRSATGGALDWTGVPRLRATTAFPGALHLGGAWQAAFSDARSRTPDDLPWHALHAAARAAGDDDAAAHAAALAVELEHRGDPALDERGGLGRLVLALADEAWWSARERSAAHGARPPLHRTSWLPSVQVLRARRTAGSERGLALAVKGGHGGEHHDHSDVGSVVVALHGVPVVVDPGRPTYTAASFGPRRYDLWVVQSAWHSVPVLRGTGQVPGTEHAARGVAVHDDDAGAALALDLAGAHPGSGVRRWLRTARLDRTDGSVVVTDAWEHDDGPPPAAGPSALHLVLAGEVSLDGDGAVLVEALDAAGCARVAWAGEEVVSASLEVRRLDDPLLTAVWGGRLTRLRLELPDVPVGSARVVVTGGGTA